METLKQHWRTIALTAVLTSFVVGAGGLIYGISASRSVPPTEATPQVDLKIKGNKNSKIYHLPGCPNYNDIAERNVVWFKTKVEAESAGYRKAKNC